MQSRQQKRKNAKEHIIGVGSLELLFEILRTLYLFLEISMFLFVAFLDLVSANMLGTSSCEKPSERESLQREIT